MRMVIIPLAVLAIILAISPLALAHCGYDHHCSYTYNINNYWALQRQADALEGIQRSLERRE